MNKSHLLINEPALQVLPSLAKAIGLEEAIILQQLHYWMNNPRVDGRVHDGRKWIYNSYQEWQENFPFWSVQQIQRIFLNLERGGVVLSAKLDAKKHDQTKFYTLDYEALCTMDESILIPSTISESNDVNKELHRLPKNTSKSDILGFMEMSEDLKNKNNIDEIEQIAVTLETELRLNFPRSTKDQQVYKRILKTGKPIEKFTQWVKSDEKRLSFAFLYAKDTEAIWRDFPQAFGTANGFNPQGLSIE